MDGIDDGIDGELVGIDALVGDGRDAGELGLDGLEELDELDELLDELEELDDWEGGGGGGSIVLHAVRIKLQKHTRPYI